MVHWREADRICSDRAQRVGIQERISQVERKIRNRQRLKSVFAILLVPACLLLGTYFGVPLWHNYRIDLAYEELNEVNDPEVRVQQIRTLLLQHGEILAWYPAIFQQGYTLKNISSIQQELDQLQVILTQSQQEDQLSDRLAALKLLLEDDTAPWSLIIQTGNDLKEQVRDNPDQLNELQQIILTAEDSLRSLQERYRSIWDVIQQGNFDHALRLADALVSEPHIGELAEALPIPQLIEVATTEQDQETMIHVNGVTALPGTQMVYRLRDEPVQVSIQSVGHTTQTMLLPPASFEQEMERVYLAKSQQWARLDPLRQDQGFSWYPQTATSFIIRHGLNIWSIRSSNGEQLWRGGIDHLLPGISSERIQFISSGQIPVFTDAQQRLWHCRTDQEGDVEITLITENVQAVDDVLAFQVGDITRWLVAQRSESQGGWSLLWQQEDFSVAHQIPTTTPRLPIWLGANDDRIVAIDDDQVILIDIDGAIRGELSFSSPRALSPAWLSDQHIAIMQGDRLFAVELGLVGEQPMKLLDEPLQIGSGSVKSMHTTAAGAFIQLENKHFIMLGWDNGWIERWRLEQSESSTNQLIFTTNDRILLVDGPLVRCLDARTGKQLSGALHSAPIISASIIQERLVVVDNEGIVTAFNL